MTLLPKPMKLPDEQQKLVDQLLDEMRPNLQDAWELVQEVFEKALAFPEKLTVTEWVDKHRVLPPNKSSVDGNWDTGLTPYLQEIMDCMDPNSPWPEIVVKKGAQLGLTEALINCILYMIDRCPGPALFVTSDLGLAKETVTDRIEPAIELMERMHSLMIPSQGRMTGKTLLKEFIGGSIKFVGAESASGLRSRSARWLYFDELSAWSENLNGEGSPEKLARRATKTWGDKAKTFIISTPKEQESCRISKLYEDSDRCVYQVPCPECGFYQQILWRNIKWVDRDPNTAMFGCRECGALSPESCKTAMLAAGRWVSTNPGYKGKRKGFHVSALYSPAGMYSWKSVVKNFLAANYPHRNPQDVQVWENQDLGEESTAQRVSALKWEPLYNRREPYPVGTVPKGGLVLYAGADVQHDRVECVVMAYGPNLESWVIDRCIFRGKASEGDVFDLLREGVLERKYPHELGGHLTIAKLAIDSSESTQDVYRWVNTQSFGQVIAIKGLSTDIGVMLGAPKAAELNVRGKRKRGRNFWPLNVIMMKKELYGWLQLPAPTHPEEKGYPLGWMHFSDQLDEDFFKQLTAEELIVKYHKGVPKQKWVARGRPNEVLDCTVYARAASFTDGIDNWKEPRWNALRAELAQTTQPNKPRRQAGNEGYFDKWQNKTQNWFNRS